MDSKACYTTLLAVCLPMLAACTGTAEDENGPDLQLGRYVRLADPSFESIQECEAAKEEANDGRLFNCAQLLTLNEDGTYVSVMTDIAEPGQFSTVGSTLRLTSDPTGSTLEIPIEDDGTLGDGWILDTEADSTDS